MVPVLRTQRDNIFKGLHPNGENEWKVREVMKFIYETSVYDMLTIKYYYIEQQIIDIVHNYSSSAESD